MFRAAFQPKIALLIIGKNGFPPPMDMTVLFWSSTGMGNVGLDSKSTLQNSAQAGLSEGH
ncbi:hypothetical protein SBA5_120077 [Candidatus Sulfotelmatomonas gaucii]|uniref:Uncharacterized protein n=1 Tax=Candidatus Sulfuritelmatomonas gaucii TaxID=2043161 RepID=A0A2N9L451_9BACT|nr:hypothetical protein SBA5_120077 [Candidatus Sulfotelmatomonas gaucii]